MLVLEAEGAAAPAPPPQPRRRPPRRSAGSRSAAARAGRCRAGRGSGGPVEVAVPDIGDFEEVAVIEVLRQAGRHGQGRAEPDHGRERQGVDGDPVVARRRASRSCKVKVGDKVNDRAR